MSPSFLVHHKTNAFVSMAFSKVKFTTTTLHSFIGLFLGQPGKPTPERETFLDFTGARDDGVAVASAGPYAYYFNLA